MRYVIRLKKKKKKTGYEKKKNADDLLFIAGLSWSYFVLDDLPGRPGLRKTSLQNSLIKQGNQ